MQWTLSKALALAGCLQSISALPVADSNAAPKLDIVHTTTLQNGQVIDWVRPESQGTIASPPPAPSHWQSAPDKPTKEAFIPNDPGHNGPEGTVPIARSSGNNLATKKLADTSLPTNNTSPGALDSYAGVHWYASTAQRVNNHGGIATYSLFDAYVQSPSDFSLLQVAVIRDGVPVSGGGQATTQTIESGWINYPDQVQQPHLFSFFTTNGYSADGDNIGGWNRDQAGFVQTDSSVYPGIAFSPLAVDGGQQYDLQIEYQLYQGNWWLWVIDRYIGYYPGSLFTKGVSSADTLETQAVQINYYGEIYNSETAMTTTDMGSGEFPQTGFGHSGYIHNIQYYDTNTNAVNYDGSQQVIVSDASRYNLQASWNSGGSWGSYFYLGGPGAGGQIGA